MSTPNHYHEASRTEDFERNIGKSGGTIAQKVAEVMAQQPDLSTYGFRYQTRDNASWNDGQAFDEYRANMLSDDFARQVETTIRAISTRAQWGHAWSLHKRSSYGLKHKVEHWLFDHILPGEPSYISNGAAIVAMILIGWQPVREWWDGPNCAFRRGVKP